jgi:hypothetical protein
MLISLKKSYYYLSKDNIIESQRIVRPMFFLSQFFDYCKSDNFLLEKKKLYMEKKKKNIHTFSKFLFKKDFSQFWQKVDTERTTCICLHGLRILLNKQSIYCNLHCAQARNCGTYTCIALLSSFINKPCKDHS